MDRSHLPPPKGRKFLSLLVVSFVFGAISTGFWFGSIQFPQLREHLFSAPAFAAGLICVALTTANILLRWFRWHFLIRRFTPHLVTRDSLMVYMATLPAILSPFFVAELGRIFLIRRRFHAPASYLVRIWFAERLLDFCVLAAALLWALNGSSIGFLVEGSIEPSLTVAGAGMLLTLVAVIFGLVLRRQPFIRKFWIALTALSLTLFAWSLPVLGLSMVLVLLESPVSLETAVRVFAGGTLVGGLTGLPLGVFATGSTMIEQLVRAGVDQSVGVLAILVYRSGTAWFAVVLGLVCLVVFRKRIFGLLRGTTEDHFDEIANEYEGEIPKHVRERLLDKKIGLITTTLQNHRLASGARGLDLGCGQGWYLMEMRKAGFSVDGTDYSQGQLDRALQNLSGQGLPAGTLLQADAQALPFADNSYDFVYSINAIHHILAEGAQARAMAEIVRVLKPGGIFLLHEINTYNPVFRWYMGYLFPLLKKIDEGNEEWILPTELPPTPGATWDHKNIQYFTFLPDFVPRFVLQACANMERALERSRFARMSAHYQACLIKAHSP